MSCNCNCDCKTVKETKVKSIDSNVAKNSPVTGVWLNTKNKNENINVYSWNNGLVISYNAPNHNELGASRMALSLKGDGCEFQFFVSDKKSGHRVVNVDSDLVYNMIFNLLKEFETKAIEAKIDSLK